MKLSCKLLSCVWLFATPWTAACQPPLFMEFSRQKFWCGEPFPSPGDLPIPGMKPGLLPSWSISYHKPSHMHTNWYVSGAVSVCFFQALSSISVFYFFNCFSLLESNYCTMLLLVSAVGQSESAIYIHISPPSWNSLHSPPPSHPSRLPQSTTLSSLCYTSGSHCAVWSVTQSCPTLCDHTDCSPPGSSAHGDSPGKNPAAGCHVLQDSFYRW